MSRLTTAELAAFLGLTPGGLRTLIRRHGIAPTGKRGRANLYDPQTVLDVIGAHDRRFTRKRRRLVAH